MSILEEQLSTKDSVLEGSKGVVLSKLKSSWWRGGS